MSLWGKFACPKCSAFSIFILESLYLIVIYMNSDIIAKRIRAILRIGPHNKDVISILYGTLLGDSHAEKRSLGHGTRISFSQESNHKDYLVWLHRMLADLGYCNPTTPKLQTRQAQGGKIRQIIRFHTYTYSSLNWLHEAWYKDGIKRVPSNIGEYMTPLALAI